MNIGLLDFKVHRNETTFRPYLMRQSELSNANFKLVADPDEADIYLIGQASIANKNLPLVESVEMGIKYCDALDKQFIIIDGQDSHSMIGTFEVFKDQYDKGKCIGLLKNSLLRDLEMYKVPYVNGRYYWGDGNYKVDDISLYKDVIKLSQSNWLSTLNYEFIFMDHVDKVHDVFAMFQYPAKVGTEHGLQHSDYYDMHRKPCIDVLNSIDDLDILKLRDGNKLPHNQYLELMMRSKVVVAPFGYGEIAPRDLEAMIFKCILIKPSMDHITTEPNIYDDGKTYISCRHDFSDLEDKVRYAVENYDVLIDEMYDNARTKFQHQYLDKTRLVSGFGNVINELS